MLERTFEPPELDRGPVVKTPQVGQTASATMTMTEEHVRQFALLSGDENPIHMDAEYASRTRFKRPIAHGVLTASLISRVAGMQLPGPGSIYLSQSTKFKQPCYVGDTVTAEVKILNVRYDKLITLSTICRNQHGEVLIEGEAMVYYEPVQ